VLSDKNAWIGMPIGLRDDDNASVRSSTSQSYNAARLQSSPYRHPVVKHDQSVNKPKRPTGLELLDSLGWKNPLTEQKKVKHQEHSLSTSGHFPERKVDSEVMNSPSQRPFSPLRTNPPPKQSHLSGISSITLLRKFHQTLERSQKVVSRKPQKL
jgi:hypothetical protein